MQDCGGGSGGGSRGGPVASFTRTTSSHSSLQRHVPIPNRMQLVRIRALYLTLGAITPRVMHVCAFIRIVATVIDYFFTICHCLLSTIFTYHCLAPVLAGKNEHRLILFAGKSEHHLDLVTCVSFRRIFTFTGHRSKYFRERAHAASVTYAHTHTHGHNQL